MYKTVHKNSTHKFLMWYSLITSGNLFKGCNQYMRQLLHAISIGTCTVN